MDDRDRGPRWSERERWRDDDERGLFAYEGEGYMRGGGRDLDRGDDPRGYGHVSAREIEDDRPSFRGLGPKNYRRSDARIHEDACERLAMDEMVDASDIEVAVHEGVVTLSGTVRDRQQKRWAEDTVERVVGVRDVQNSIRVKG